MGDRQEQKRRLLLKRARQRDEAILVERFFGGDGCAYQWSDARDSLSNSLSPTWRRWITTWSAVHSLSEWFKAIPRVIVRFGSMPEVGGVVASGRTVQLNLKAWVAEDSELLRFSDPVGCWRVSLDIDDGEAPRLILLVAGERRIDFGSLGEGTQAWRWDFLSESLNTAVEDIKHLLLDDTQVDQNLLQELLGESGLLLQNIEQVGADRSVRLIIGVGGERRDHKNFDSLRRALVAEIPGLHVVKSNVSSH